MVDDQPHQHRIERLDPERQFLRTGDVEGATVTSMAASSLDHARRRVDTDCLTAVLAYELADDGAWAAADVEHPTAAQRTEIDDCSCQWVPVCGRDSEFGVALRQPLEMPSRRLNHKAHGTYA